MTTSSVTSKIWTGLILIAACMAAGFFANKFYHNYSDAKVYAKQFAGQGTQLSQGADAADRFLAAYFDRKADIQTLNLTLPAHDSDMSNFVSSLGQIAAASGVSLSGLQISEGIQAKAVENTIQSVNVNLTARGSYPSLKDFILRMENNQRLMDLTHLTLTADENGNLQYQMSIRTYYQK